MIEIDYTTVISLAVDIVKMALPIGLVFLLVEKLVSIFIKMVFGKWGV